MHTTIAKVIELSCEGVDAKRINATLSHQNADMEAKFVEARAFSIECTSNLQDQSVK